MSGILCTLKSRINSHTVGAGKSSYALKAQETLSAWSKKSGYKAEVSYKTFCPFLYQT